MPRFVGTLNIIGNDSNLSGTALAMVDETGDPFENATRFLTQDRHLSRGNRIFVDGNTIRIGEQNAINITEAGRALPAVVGAGGALMALAEDAFTAPPAGKGRARKGGAKKGGAKKAGGKKSSKKAGSKSGGK